MIKLIRNHKKIQRGGGFVTIGVNSGVSSAAASSGTAATSGSYGTFASLGLGATTGLAIGITVPAVIALIGGTTYMVCCIKRGAYLANIEMLTITMRDALQCLNYSIFKSILFKEPEYNDNQPIENYLQQIRLSYDSIEYLIQLQNSKSKEVDPTKIKDSLGTSQSSENTQSTSNDIPLDGDQPEIPLSGDKQRDDTSNQITQKLINIINTELNQPSSDPNQSIFTHLKKQLSEHTRVNSVIKHLYTTLYPITQDDIEKYKQKNSSALPKQDFFERNFFKSSSMDEKVKYVISEQNLKKIPIKDKLYFVIRIILSINRLISNLTLDVTDIKTHGYTNTYSNNTYTAESKVIQLRSTRPNNPYTDYAWSNTNVLINTERLNQSIVYVANYGHKLNDNVFNTYNMIFSAEEDETQRKTITEQIRHSLSLNTIKTNVYKAINNSLCHNSILRKLKFKPITIPDPEIDVPTDAKASVGNSQIKIKFKNLQPNVDSTKVEGAGEKSNVDTTTDIGIQEQKMEDIVKTNSNETQVTSTNWIQFTILLIHVYLHLERSLKDQTEDHTQTGLFTHHFNNSKNEYIFKYILSEHGYFNIKNLDYDKIINKQKTIFNKSIEQDKCENNDCKNTTKADKYKLIDEVNKDIQTFFETIDISEIQNLPSDEILKSDAEFNSFFKDMIDILVSASKKNTFKPPSFFGFFGGRTRKMQKQTKKHKSRRT